MRRMSWMAALAFTLVCCGSSAFEAAPCTIAYSGEISGAANCTRALGTSDRAEVQGCGNYPQATYCSTVTLDPQFSMSDAGASVQAWVTLPGQLAQGTYTSQGPGAGASIEIIQGPTRTPPASAWRAEGPIGGPPSSGTWALTITAIGPPANTWNLLHGTLDATLAADPSTSATGTVTLHAAF